MTNKGTVEIFKARHYDTLTRYDPLLKSTVTRAPELIFRSSSFIASGLSIFLWIDLFNGRAPKAGSYASCAR